jgi:hypothetical protein
MTTRFENLDSKTQDTIDKTLSTINSIWTTWFPPTGNTGNTGTGNTGTGNTGNTGGGNIGEEENTPKPPIRTPAAPPKRSYKGLIYAGVGLGVLGVGFLIYKAVKKKK